MNTKYLEVGTDKWAIVVEIRTCGNCYFGGRWWRQELWQNPATGTVHATNEWRSNKVTACGIELPKGTPEHRIHMAIREAS